MKCQLITNGQLISNGMLIDYQCNTNQLPIECRLIINGQLTNNGQLITNLIPTAYQLTMDYRWISIDYQWTIKYKWNDN